MKDVRQLKCNRFYTFWNENWSFQHTKKCCNSSRPTTTPSSSSSWHSHSLSTFFQSLQRYTRAIREWGGENIQYNASLDVQESRKSAIFIKRLIYNNNKNREKFHEANNASDQFNKEKHDSNHLTMIAQCLYLPHTHTHASFYFHCSAVHSKGKNSVRNKMCDDEQKVALIVLCIKCIILEL